MKRSQYTEEQIVRAIDEHEQGKKAEKICRKLGRQSSDVLRLEETIRRAGDRGTGRSQAVARGECTFEAAGSGSEVGSSDSAGGDEAMTKSSKAGAEA